MACQGFPAWMGGDPEARQSERVLVKFTELGNCFKVVHQME